MSSNGSNPRGAKLNINSHVIEALPGSSCEHEPDEKLPRDERSGIVSRVGKTSAAVLVLSYVVCFGCLAFLTFLWAVGVENNVWRSIVLAGWIPRSITITALILRSAITAQAVTCTSMLAAILLQKYGVPLHTAAVVSLMRFDNTGPWTLLWKTKAEWHRDALLIVFFLVSLSLTLLSSQLTSTALLSQVGLALLPVTISTPETFYTIDPSGSSSHVQPRGDSSYLFATPKEFPAFAEWIPNGTAAAQKYGGVAPSSSPGIRDTGTVVRAFLPIGNLEDRNRVTDYKGFGTAVDMRVVCVRPKFSMIDINNGSSPATIYGQVINDLAPPGLFRSEDGSAMFFDCAFDAAGSNYSAQVAGWPVSICMPVQGENHTVGK